ncbi:hypothetical protein AQJ67_27275 [Streptomyces caeruleatus]|uniref:Uncharacterized protein n=1 Tax=Streptomyces caeruleatus TaxID=661399 RepID=A0A101TU07_9ACTN|nr:hypothetical protein AQJ67_27275 [Streptomyces caeruleatus]
MEPGQQVHDAQSRWPEASDIAHHDSCPGGLQPGPHGVAQPCHLVPGDGAGQHEYSGCHGIHDR